MLPAVRDIKPTLDRSSLTRWSLFRDYGLHSDRAVDEEEDEDEDVDEDAGGHRGQKNRDSLPLKVNLQLAREAQCSRRGCLHCTNAALRALSRSTPIAHCYVWCSGCIPEQQDDC